MIHRRTIHIAWVDTLIALLLVLLVVTVVKKTPTADAGIPPKAEFVVELIWPDHSASDIDMWFRAPTGETINFIQKQSGPWSLDRDDLGQVNDKLLQPDGSYRTLFVNREMLTMRGVVAGTYTINLHVYSWRDDAPIEATVRMTRLNPFKIVLERQVTLSLRGQEVTVASVTLNQSGAVTNLDYTQRTLTRRQQ